LSNKDYISKKAGLAAWKTHISGDDDGSIEVNPSLNADYMPTNTQCAGMGIPPVPLEEGIPRQARDDSHAIRGIYYSLKIYLGHIF